MTAGLFALLIATVVSIEATRRLRIFPAFARLSAHSRRAGRLLVRTGVSEWAKERALQLASRRMFGLAIAAASRLALVAAPFLLIFWIDRRHPYGLARTWTDWPARFWGFGLTSAYILVRRLLGKGDRMLQHAGLGVRSLLDMSFDMERAVHGRRATALQPGAPVFICGVARSGTSILLRELHREGAFASLSYRDLPFPLAPNLWMRLNAGRSRSIAAVERGHGDGLLHDLDSPEAIEEVFWLCHEGGRFRRATHLHPISPRAQTFAAFDDYMRLVLLRCGNTRYLSKNNANVMRLPGLVARLPDAILIHPFRDPLQQAESLRRQHLRAHRLAAADPFRTRFMTWLGHHEFGADHRPIRFPDSAAATSKPGNDPAHIEYWLRIWIDTYRHLTSQPGAVRAHQHFLDYDGLCEDPDGTSRRIGRMLGLQISPSFDRIRPAVRHAVCPCDPALLAEARTVHAELRERAIATPSQ